MATVGQIYDYINSFAPFSTALPFDNTGISVGSRNTETSKIGVCLDVTESIIKQAVKLGCQLIISHHPVIFNPLKSISQNDILYLLIKNGIYAISAHTNLDAANGGVNDCLCDALDIKNVQALENTEFPGYPPLCRIGELQTEISAADFAIHIKNKLACPCVAVSKPEKKIKTVAVCSGAGAEYAPLAMSFGANAFVTSEIKHHQWCNAERMDISLFDCGHFATEAVVLKPLAKKLQTNFSNTTVFSLVQSMPYTII